MGDVSIEAQGVPGTPIGATIVHQAGSIPTAYVDLCPGNGEKISKKASFGDIEGSKRSEASVSISVKIAINGEKVTRKVHFTGLLDGMSISNVAGNVSYQAVIKNKAQAALELTTLTPGLYPGSINIFKPSNYDTVTSAQGEDAKVEAWTNLEQEVDTGLNPVEFYTELMKVILKKQEGGWREYLQDETCVDGAFPFENVYSSGPYKKNLGIARDIFENLDLSSVTKGALANLTAESEDVLTGMEYVFKHGPPGLLENYMQFLSSIGCSMLFGNSKAWVVPANSVFKPQASEVNIAKPIDIVSYSYNDGGFKDLGHVVVCSDGGEGGGGNLGDETFDTSVIGCYSAEQTNASGVLVLNIHPWMGVNPFGASASDSPEGSDKYDKESESMYSEKESLGDAAKKASQGHKEAADTARNAYKSTLKEVANSYAECKYHQFKYFDRQGSLTTDFNPNWAPGVGGVLYTETGVCISFFVTSVTHKVDLVAPSSGQAMTTITYTSGRISSGPSGVEGDKFLGADGGTDAKVASAFVNDCS